MSDDIRLAFDKDRLFHSTASPPWPECVALVQTNPCTLAWQMLDIAVSNSEHSLVRTLLHHFQFLPSSLLPAMSIAVTRGDLDTIRYFTPDKFRARGECRQEYRLVLCSALANRHIHEALVVLQTAGAELGGEDWQKVFGAACHEGQIRARHFLVAEHVYFWTRSPASHVPPVKPSPRAFRVAYSRDRLLLCQAIARDMDDRAALLAETCNLIVPVDHSAALSRWFCTYFCDQKPGSPGIDVALANGTLLTYFARVGGGHNQMWFSALVAILLWRVWRAVSTITCSVPTPEMRHSFFQSQIKH